MLNNNDFTLKIEDLVRNLDVSYEGLGLLRPKSIHPNFDEFDEKEALKLYKEEIKENEGTLVSVSNLFDLVLKLVKTIDIFVTLIDKEFGLMPCYYDFFKFVKDPDSIVLKTIINSVVKKLLNSEVNKSFDEILENKIKNSLDYAASITKSVIARIVLDFKQIHEEEFDNVKFLINTPLGVLNLKTLEVRERTKDDLFLCCTKACFLPDYHQEPKKFTGVIRKVLEPTEKKLHRDTQFGPKNPYDQTSEERFDSLMRLYGYMLTGEKKKKIVMEVGCRDSAKSSRHAIIRSIMGDYVGSVAASGLVRSSRTKNDIRPELVNTRHYRIIISAEPGPKDILDEKFLKSYSGGDSQSFRKPRSGVVVEFTPRGIIIISSNYFPRMLPLDDDGFFSRLILVKTSNKIPDNMKNPNYLDEMSSQENMDKVFTYLARFAQKYYKEGLHIHPTFLTDKLSFLAQQECPVSLFYKYCITAPGHDIGYQYRSKELFGRFNDFRELNGITETMSRKSFSLKLKDILEAKKIFKINQTPKDGGYYNQFYCNPCEIR